MDTLAALHGVDYEAVGLGDYGRPTGSWPARCAAGPASGRPRRFHEVAEIEELGARLAGSVPVQRRATIVHGDYRLDNVRAATRDDPGRINAVLDWELSTLGDPLTDLALLLLFWREEGEPELSLIPGVTHLPGFPTRAQMLSRYADSAGVDVSDMDWYLAFAHFKFAVIAQGVVCQVAGRRHGRPGTSAISTPRSSAWASAASPCSDPHPTRTGAHHGLLPLHQGPGDLREHVGLHAVPRLPRRTGLGGVPARARRPRAPAGDGGPQAARPSDADCGTSSCPSSPACRTSSTPRWPRSPAGRR